MANVAGLQETRGERRRSAQAARRPVATSEVGVARPPRERPAAGIHPRAFRLPLVAAAWFVITMAISFADTLETGYLMAIVAGFAVVFFGLTISLAMHASGSAGWLSSARTYRRFAHGEVDVLTGTMSGREVLVQLTVLPITLALGGMAIGLVYLASR